MGAKRPPPAWGPQPARSAVGVGASKRAILTSFGPARAPDAGKAPALVSRREPGTAYPRNGYRHSLGGSKVSLITRAETHRSRFILLPALSFVDAFLPGPPT